MSLQMLNVRGHTFISDLLNASSIVVDLGGNLGDFSKSVTETYHCKSYVVEPVPALYDQIVSSPQVSKFNLALSSVTQPVSFFTTENIEGGSLQKRAASLERIDVQGISLADFFNENNLLYIDLLKVDIEGAEVELFDTVSREVLRNIKQITVEFHDFVPELMSRQDVRRVKKRLQRSGFYCIPWKLLNNLDVLFVNKDNISYIDYLFIKYVARYYSKITSRMRH